MKDFINSCIKSYGVKSVVQRKIIDGDLNAYYIIFIDNEDFCKTGLFLFNESEIFVMNKSSEFIAIGNGYEPSLRDKVIHRLNTYDSLKSYYESNEYLDKVQTKFRQFVELYRGAFLEAINQYSKKFINIHIVSKEIYFSPKIALVIHYTVNGVFQEPIVCNIKETCKHETEDNEVNEFIQYLNKLTRSEKVLCKI
ncbi:hypothetical protein D3C81_674760 [compost metagenome]